MPRHMVSIRAAKPDDSPSSGVTPQLTEAIGHLFGKLRTWSMRRVEEVNQMTSNESLAAGDSLNSIVNQSRNYVNYMREAMGRFAANDNGEDDAGIGAIEEQGTMLAAYLRNLETALASQEKVAQEALRQLSAVRRAGSHILEVSNQARMLAVNARIEAARLTGSDGGAFGVIASEMSTFAKNMQSQSDEIVQIVDGLTGSLPAIAEMTEELRTRTADFSGEFSEKNEEVSAVVAQLQTTIANALQQGDDRIAEILKHSQEALSHLQFQDPCAQRLMQIEADILQAQTTAKDVLESGDIEIVDRVNAADSHREASAGHVMIFDDMGDEDGDGEGALPAGELLLF